MNTVRRIFLGLFIVSTLAVLVLFVSLLQSSADMPASSITSEPGIVPTPSTGGPETDPSSQNPKNVNFTALLGTVVTSITSLVGFVTTTVITWRKEKRESSLADLERKKLEMELEKNRLELENLKNSTSKKKDTK